MCRWLRAGCPIQGKMGVHRGQETVGVLSFVPPSRARRNRLRPCRSSMHLSLRLCRIIMLLFLRWECKIRPAPEESKSYPSRRVGTTLSSFLKKNVRFLALLGMTDGKRGGQIQLMLPSVNESDSNCAPVVSSRCISMLPALLAFVTPSNTTVETPKDCPSSDAAADESAPSVML